MPSQSHQLDDLDLYYTDAYNIRILHNNKKDVCGEKYLSNCDLMRENYVNKSNQSLCSCSNVEPVIDINPAKPLYQYSLDRKNGKTHTYSCEQNALILARIAREKQRMKQLKQMSNNSNETHNSSFELTYMEHLGKCPKNHMRHNSSYLDISTIPPPPPMPLNRKPSIRSQISPKKQFSNKINSTKSTPCNTTSLLNCVNNRMQKLNSQINCSDTILTSCDINININNNKNDNTNTNSNKQQNKFTRELIENQQFNPKLNLLNRNNSCSAIDPMAHNCQSSTALENDSMFFYQHEPTIIPYHHDTEHINFPGKYNTIGSSKYYHNSHELNKFHASTCNSLKSYHKSSNSLLDGRYFSSSLTNFNYPSLQNHQYITDGVEPRSSYAQYHNNTDIDPSMMDPDPYESNLSIKHPDVQQFGSHIPWRHRHCPSIGSSSSGASFTKWDASRHWLAVTLIVLIAGAAGVAVPLALRVSAEAPFEERLQVATQLLTSVPLIDGHNDLPWNIRKFVHNQLNDFQFDVNLKTVPPWSKSHWSHTDLIRLKKGQVSAQFWAAYVPCEAQYRDAVQLTLEQIDVIIRLTEKYAPQLTTCTSAIDILEAHKNHQLCSLTGVEGGHSLGGSLSVLRTFYALGVRYMTLTSTCHTPWADSSYADAPKFEVKHGGLTEFGKTIIREMNRLGMIVDLSHVSVGTMRDALAVSEAPVIFSHSSAYELCNSSRNVQDSILQLIGKNRGLVMINFYSKFLSCSENATVQNAVDHLNHIKLVAGVDHVGLGAGFDGINFTPKGLEDVSTYPVLFAELLGYGWTMDELTKLAGLNFLRVLEEVEMVRDKKRDEGTKPYEEILNVRLDDTYNCTSS